MSKAFTALQKLIGLRLLSLCMAATAMLPAQTWLSFSENVGVDPPYAPTQTASGALFGTAGGGVFNSGTVYAVTSKGLAPFHTFYCSTAWCPDGSPSGPLVQAPNGTLYGAAFPGGANGFGTIYQIAPDGAFTVLHSFTSLKGGGVLGGLIQAANGDFYGVTQSGGENDSGTIFRMTAGGAVTPLYSFCSHPGSACPGGQTPISALVQASTGDLYGLSENGTTSAIYKLTLAGQFTTVYTFCTQSDCPDGSFARGFLTMAADGSLYGGSTGAGTSREQGVIFRISPDDHVTVFHTFKIPKLSEALQMIPGSDGNLYGVAESAIYRLTPDGDVTVILNVPSVPKIQENFGSITGLGQYTSGLLFATTIGGGQYGQGVILSFDAGLPPFVKAQPGSGGAGSAVTILGTSLAGATSVTFGGAPAVFTVTSDHAISATVPAGATNGAIQVVTPQGTLSTDVPFFIL
jgi:uncharacterized repeat protein (TIGR03803 family)